MLVKGLGDGGIFLVAMEVSRWGGGRGVRGEGEGMLGFSLLSSKFSGGEKLVTGPKKGLGLLGWKGLTILVY